MFRPLLGEQHAEECLSTNQPQIDLCLTSSVDIMKKLSLLVTIALLASSVGSGCASGLNLQTGGNLDWWGEYRGSHASQYHFPVLIEGKYRDLSVRFLTAYAETEITAPGSGTVRLGHILDSKLGGAYQLLDKLPVDLMFGLDLNLPTGKTNLTQAETRLIMDPNLISINTFGEGFNVNPTVTAAKTWNDWSAALGFGYLWRGAYDFSAELNLTDYQPGAVYSVTAETRYTVSPEMVYRLFVAYSRYGKDTSRGITIFNEGDVGIFGIGGYYKKSRQWEATLLVTGVIREGVTNYDRANGTAALATENPYRDEFILDLRGRYLLDAKTVIAAPIQYKYLTGNGYTGNDPRNLGGANKVSFGVGITRALWSGLSAEVNLKGFYLHGGVYHPDTPTSTSDYTGITGNMALIGAF